nr:hypothetical protein [Tanacetum cinerariifolium]
DANRDVNVTETFHEQTYDELSEKELKQIEADDQAIQTILRGLPEDIYAAVDSCETAQEIWLRVQQMMKGSDIGIQEKKAIDRHVTIIHLTKDLHTADYTQLYDFLKYNQKEGISSNPRNRQIAQPGMNMGQDRQMQMIGEEYDLMAAAADLDEIEEVNANCILMVNLQQASSSGTKTDSTPVYDTDESAEQVPHNDNNVISEVTDVEQDGETVEQHSANF